MISRFRQLYRERRAVRWATDGVLLLAVIVGITAWQTRQHLHDVPAPAFTLTTLAGPQVSIDSLKGKKTLLYLWAPWCGVCKAESQNVSWVRALVGERANVVSIVSSFQQVGDVERYVSEHGVQYPVLLGDESVEQAFHVQAFPTLYFLDENGRIVRSATGYTTTLGLWWRLML